MTNSKCTIASTRRRLRLSAVSGYFAKLSWYHVVNKVHIGLPTKKRGFCSRRSRRARSRLCGKLKSEGLLSAGSVHVRSMATPGRSAAFGIDDKSFVSRGGEYTSETRCLKDLLRSLLKALELTPIDSIMSRLAASSKIPKSIWALSVFVASPPGIEAGSLVNAELVVPEAGNALEFL